jgi:hypothetical protein
MTPPDANIDKQRRRHRPVIWGIAAVALLAIVVWIALSGQTNDMNDAPVVGDTLAPPAETGGATVGTD